MSPVMPLCAGLLLGEIYVVGNKTVAAEFFAAAHPNASLPLEVATRLCID
jgi:hypothetical protein